MRKGLSVLLTRPHEHYFGLNLQDLLRVCRVSVPLGLLYLAETCRRTNVDHCVVADPLVNAIFPDIKKMNFPLKEFVWGNLMEKELENLSPDFKPDIICLSVMFSHLYTSAIESARELKKKYPQSLLIIGGADPTAKCSKYLLASSDIDFVVLGEGEVVLHNFIHALRENIDFNTIQGLAYLKDGQVVKTEASPAIKNLDDYRPCYEYIDLEKYFHVNKVNFPPRISFHYPESNRSISFITSRGCPFKCVFCSIKIHMGSNFRYNSPEFVVSEMAYLYKKYQVKHFHFDDDNLTLRLSRFKKICELIIANNLKITWDTPNGVRGDILDDEALDLAIRSGCTYLLFGIESGVQRVLDEVVKKDLNLEKSIKNLERCFQANLDTGAFYIIGFPGETKADIKKTISFALKMFWLYKTRPHLNIARPYEGTELYQKVVENNMLVEHGHQIETIPTLVTLSKMIKNEEFDIEFLNQQYRRFQFIYILISAANWIRFFSLSPLMFGKKIINSFTSFYLANRNIKVSLIKTYIGVVLFPFSIKRKSNPS